MTMSSKDTYSRHISQCFEKDIIAYISWLNELGNRWGDFKERLVLEMIYLFGSEKEKSEDRVINEWFSDFPEAYLRNGIWYKLNVGEFPKNKLIMVESIISKVQDFREIFCEMYNIDCNEERNFGLYTFDNDRLNNDGFIYAGKYIFINIKAMKHRLYRQSIFLHEYCHYISKGGFFPLVKIDEGITEYIAYKIAKNSNITYVRSDEYRYYFNIAKTLIEQDWDIMTAYLSADAKMQEKYIKELQPIERALNGKGSVQQAIDEYVNKKSHEL